MRHDLKYSGNLIHCWCPRCLNVTKQFTNENEVTEIVDLSEHKCRVWVEGRKPFKSRNGYETISGNYKECKAKYDELKDDYYVRLQVFNKYLPRCGTNDLEDNTWSDPEYQKAYERYRQELEDEDESRNWQPGDAPWKAPGMSISDFI